jgi:hypothetical protein
MEMGIGSVNASQIGRRGKQLIISLLLKDLHRSNISEAADRVAARVKHGNRTVAVSGAQGGAGRILGRH